MNITITALDLTNAVAPDYRGTIHFTSNDPSAILPADYTFTAADAGTHTFHGTFVSVQPLTVTVTDTAKATITGTVANIRVNPPVGQLVVTASSSSTLAGTAISITVTAQDIFAREPQPATREPCISRAMTPWQVCRQTIRSPPPTREFTRSR